METIVTKHVTGKRFVFVAYCRSLQSYKRGRNLAKENMNKAMSVEFKEE